MNSFGGKSSNFKKVLLTIPCLKLGGTEIQTLSLAKVLLNTIKPIDEESVKLSSSASNNSVAGLTIYILCYFEHDNIIIKEFLKIGCNVRLLNLDREVSFISLIIRIRKEINLIKPDVVHVQYMSPGAISIIASRLARVKTIFATVHQPWTHSHGVLSKLLLWLSSLLSTRFIAVSVNAEKSWFASGRLFDESKKVRLQSHHFTIYNSIDTERILKITSAVNAENLKKNLFINEGLPVLGAVARLRSEKGINILIEAFNLLIKSGIKAHLLIVGSGPSEFELKEIVVDNGIDQYVTFYGYADWEKSMQLIAIMDIVVVPSRFEGFGLSAAEAMAAGKTVVAADCYGLKEVVEDLQTGLTFKSGDISDLKEKLQMLLENISLWKIYGTAGQKRAAELFDISVFRKKIAALYESYLKI